MKKEGSLKELLNQDWQLLLKEEFELPYFKDLEAFVAHAYQENPSKVYPPRNAIFNALNKCKLSDLKVIVLGQDPYHGHGQANGFAFSVNSGVKIPPSLVNIFKELSADLSLEKPISGDLTYWANQGVLLLNNVLTVEEGKPNSHAKKGWETFTSAILRLVNERLQNKVYLLWGKDAHKKAAFINATQNLVIKTSHPSPLGCSKAGDGFVAFSGSNCFSIANKYLITNGFDPIVWQLPHAQLNLFD